mmetsp:Transcript_67157/g.110456  ORF Transcript_67157/g.110456 Transcript_67157/m.110456 type:complete len:86 (+) Transcript_67157:540-797(+)
MQSRKSLWSMMPIMEFSGHVNEEIQRPFQTRQLDQLLLVDSSRWLAGSVWCYLACNLQDPWIKDRTRAVASRGVFPPQGYQPVEV